MISIIFCFWDFLACSLMFPHDLVLAMTSHTASLMTRYCKKCNALSQEKASRGVGRVLCVTCAALLPLFAHYHCSNLFVFQLKRGVCKNPNPSSKQNPYLMSYFFASLPLCQFHINTLSHQHLKPSKA